MEKESNPMQALCRSGCGFYGCPATDGLCSLCYKEALKKKQQPPVSAPSPSSSTFVSSRPSPMETATALPGLPSPICSSEPSTDLPIMSQSRIPAGNERRQEWDPPATTAADDGPDDAPVSSTSYPDIAEDDSVNPGSSVEAPENDGSDKDDKDAKKKKNRCAVCRKKVGLTGFECRCGGLFCAAHRYSDKHDCSFNYREMGAQEIRRNNPVVVGEKIQKI